MNVQHLLKEALNPSLSASLRFLAPWCRQRVLHRPRVTAAPFFILNSTFIPPQNDLRFHSSPSNVSLFCHQLAASPLSLERPTCVPAATRRCISVSNFPSNFPSASRCLRRRRGCLTNASVSHALAEKVTSLGKDWHRPCLRCDRCSKTLAAGSHAEVLL